MQQMVRTMVRARRMLRTLQQLATVMEAAMEVL
jgi:hypothetical protein